MYETKYYNNVSKPILVFIIVFIIIIVVLLFSNLGDNNGSFLKYIEILLWIVLIVFFVLYIIRLVFNIDITMRIKKFFTNEPEIDLIVNHAKKELEKKQVFHIQNNKYDYEDAKSVCKAYNSKLANWKEMDEAFRKGADWCSYGWSEGQMALFPTQFDKWSKLQEIDGHENDCGRPGINGGYISNPNIKFGINCFGQKPKINENEEILMLEHDIYPKTKKEINFNDKVKYWKNNINNILISPFNKDRWYE